MCSRSHSSNLVKAHSNRFLRICTYEHTHGTDKQVNTFARTHAHTRTNEYFFIKKNDKKWRFDSKADHSTIACHICHNEFFLKISQSADELWHYNKETQKKCLYLSLIKKLYELELSFLAMPQRICMPHLPH